MNTRQRFYSIFFIMSMALIGCTGNDKPSAAEQLELDLQALRAAIFDTVPDKYRADQTVALIDELSRVTAEVRKDQLTFRQNFRQLNGNHGSTREQFEKLFEAYNVDIEMNQKHALAVRKEMAELLNEEEWAELASLREEALQSVTSQN